MKDTGVDAYIAGSRPPYKNIFKIIRMIIVEADPGIEEGIKWGVPTFSLNGIICNFSMGRYGPSGEADDYVRLEFFNGANLPDPEKHLDGTGKGLRHMKIRSLKDLDRKYVAKLVADSIEINRRKKQ